METEAIRISISYSYKDDALKQELEKRLAFLEREGLITVWHNCNIQAGQEWAKEIDRHLNTAQIIILLISPDFIQSDHYYSTEMMLAMKKNSRREVHVILIILRPVDWESTPFSKLQVLPTNKKPVTKWKNRVFSLEGTIKNDQKQEA